MSSPRDNSPRRYFVDDNGKRVLIGLTIEETSEFEALDSGPALDDAGGHAAWDESGVPTSARERRWLELYSKHDSAWTDWKAKIRANRSETSDFVNHP
jgi:hypothetical protein